MYRLPEELRPRFQEPFGPVYTTAQLFRELKLRDRVVTVGDVVAMTLMEAKREPRIMVVDYKTRRGQEDPSLRRVLGSWGKKVLRVENAAGTISDDLFHAVAQALKSKRTVRIEVVGEEDLAGLPVLALSKDGTVLLYGVPDRGVCMVRVDSGIRRTAQELLARMKTPT